VQISRLSNDRTRLMALFEAVHDHLPPSNRKLLSTLLPFLALIADHAASNKVLF
jgi:hypothetical protein